MKRARDNRTCHICENQEESLEENIKPGVEPLVKIGPPIPPLLTLHWDEVVGK